MAFWNRYSTRNCLIPCIFHNYHRGFPRHAAAFLWAPAHYLTAAPLYSARADWFPLCEQALLVSQTLNRALALIITANLWSLLVIHDTAAAAAAASAAADSYHRPAQKYID